MGCSQTYEKNEELNAKIKKEKNFVSNSMQSKEEKNLIKINFQTDDKKFNHLISCYEDDIFNKVTKTLFEERQEFKKYGKIFLYNGNQVNETKSLKENKIKDKDIIILKKKKKIKKK